MDRLLRSASLAIEAGGFVALVYAAFLLHLVAGWAAVGLVLLNYAYGVTRS